MRHHTKPLANNEMIEIKKLCRDWLAFAEATEGYRKEFLRKADFLIYPIVSNDPKLAWTLILQLAQNTHNPEVQAFLGAGHLEDFINKYGPEYIDEIERLTHEDMAFRDVCVHVWPSDDLPKDIYDRLMTLKELPLSDEM